MKKIISLCMGASLLASMSFASEIGIFFNGEKLVSDVPPVEINDRVMVPIRVISEKAGATVDFNYDTNEVTLTNNHAIVKLKINSNIGYINNQQKVLDVPATEINNRTLVPVRFVGEALGLNVDWNEATYAVSIQVNNGNVVNNQITYNNYPILKNGRWFSGDVSNVTKISFVNNYIPTGKEDETFNVDEKNVGTIKCYVLDNELIVAGSGTGKLMANSDSSYMFGGYQWRNLQEISGLDILDTSNVINMQGMFEGCSSLRKINVSNWNVGNVTNMSSMFEGCSSLREINVSNWNVGNVTNMSGMFGACSSLAGLDVSNWNVGNATNMSGMFRECSMIAYLDVSKWNTSNVTNMRVMFNNCRCLAELDITNWDVHNVKDITSMFEGCDSLKGVDISVLDVNKQVITDIQQQIKVRADLRTSEQIAKSVRIWLTDANVNESKNRENIILNKFVKCSEINNSFEDYIYTMYEPQSMENSHFYVTLDSNTIKIVIATSTQEANTLKNTTKEYDGTSAGYTYTE